MKRISRTLLASASRRAGNSEKVATNSQNFEDAPRASITTHRKTARGSPLTARISRMLHAPASGHAENNQMVATYAQNFEDASRASVKPRCDHRHCFRCNLTALDEKTIQMMKAVKNDERGSQLMEKIRIMTKNHVNDERRKIWQTMIRNLMKDDEMWRVINKTQKYDVNDEY